MIARQRGSISVVMASVAAMVLVLVLGTTDVARVLAGRDDAQTAADSAALAAAQDLAITPGADPTSTAAAYADLNGAHLISCTCSGTRAQVTVSEQVANLLLGFGTRTVTATALAVVDLHSS